MDGHIDQMYVCVCPEHPRRFQAVHYLKKVGGRSSKRWKGRYRPRNDGTWGFYWSSETYFLLYDIWSFVPILTL